MNASYDPQPVDVSDINLPSGLDALLETLAENVHDTWALERFRQGWHCGPVRNDDLKESPCLIPYDLLSDAEKEYDRATALSTLKLIVKFGFEIRKIVL